jgi:hypothetical protein
MNDHEADRLNVAPGQPHDSLLSETLSYVVGLGLEIGRDPSLHGFVVRAGRVAHSSPVLA